MTTARVLGLILILAVPPALAEKAVPRDGGSDSGSSRSESSHPSSGSSSSSSSGSSSSGSSDTSSQTWSGSSGSSGSSSSGSRSGSGSGSGSSHSPSSDRAVPRSGSGGSRDSGSAGVRSNDRSSGRDRDSSSSGRASSYDDRSEAERRHPRPGPHGSGYQGSGGGRYYDPRGGYSSHGYGRVQYGHYGSHYHGSLYLTHSCYIYDDYYYGYPRYRYYYADSDPVGSVRVLVDPSETKVYVDGYYAGVVDDFDGIFQRLYLPPGRHDITLKLDGYKSHRIRIYSAPGHTIKLHHDMVRGQGEDVEDLSGPGGDDRDDLITDRERDEAEARVGADPGRGGLGTVRLDVKPRDASVYVDGEFWGTGIRDDVKLPAGRHEISIVRPGFQNYERTIDVRPDDTIDVEVELRKS